MDLDFLLEVDEHYDGDLNKVEGAWVGAIGSVRHRLLLGRKHGHATKWYHALHHFPNSGVLCWPGTMHKHQTKWGAIQYFIHDDRCEDPIVMEVTEADNIPACTFTWKSHLWQVKNFSPKALPKGPRVLPVVDEGPAPLIKIAAKNAFWALPKSTVQDFAKLYSIQLTGSSLCAVLHDTIQGILECSEKACMNIMMKRLAVSDISLPFEEAVLDIDEAAAVLDPMDIPLLKQEKKVEESTKAERDEFVRDFGERQAQNRGAGSRGGGPPAQQPLPDRILQSHAKRFIPQGSYIWRGLQSNSWHGHLQPHRRIGASAVAMGDEEAMKDIFRRLWRQYLDMHGLPDSHCPWAGLL